MLNFHMSMHSLNNSMLPSSTYLLLDNLTIIYNFVIGCQVEREKTSKNAVEHPGTCSHAHLMIGYARSCIGF